MKQTSFLKYANDPLFKTQLAFGGTLMRKAKFRTFRPLDRKHPHHLVLRSSQAVGQWSFLKAVNYNLIKKLTQHCASKNGVRIAELSINRDHIHLLIWIGNRACYKRFIRSLTGLIALRITNLGTKNKLSKKFWDYRPFTRVVMGWKGYKIVRDYITLNKLETMGVIDYQPQRLRTVHRPLLS